MIRLDNIRPEDRPRALALADKMIQDEGARIGTYYGHGSWTPSDPSKQFWVWKTKTGVTVKGVYE